MTSLKDFFPLHGVHKQQKNFIKENIQRVKGCNHCIKKKEINNVGVKKCENERQKIPVKYNIKSAQPMIRYNVKIFGRDKADLTQKLKNTHSESELADKSKNQNEISKNYKNQECQTDAIYNDDEAMSEFKSSCTLCGHMVHKRNVALQAAVPTESGDQVLPVVPDYPELSCYANERTDGTELSADLNKMIQHKENICRKLDNNWKPTSNYKMGVVPRYLKERNAKHEQKKQELKEQERLDELLGLKDPDCPAGHMLMSKTERTQRLNLLQKEFDEHIRQLNTMPVSSDSYKIRQRKIQIEKELNRIEEAINALKKTKVFVKIDT